MKKNILPSIVLGAICLVVALLLSVVNMLTAPIIADRQNAAANEALLEVLPSGKNFKEVELTADYPAIVTKGYTADGGCVFQMEVTGKSTGLIIMVGVDSDGKVTGTKVISNQETPSYAEKVFPTVEGTSGKYTDMTLEGFEPQLVSGATLTSRAFSEAVKAALQAAVSLRVAQGFERLAAIHIFALFTQDEVGHVLPLSVVVFDEAYKHGHQVVSLFLSSFAAFPAQSVAHFLPLHFSYIDYIIHIAHPFRMFFSRVVNVLPKALYRLRSHASASRSQPRYT
jgi:electron transport complex protein RnfG